MNLPRPRFAAAAGPLNATTWCLWLAGELDRGSEPRLSVHLAAAARQTDADLIIVDLADVTFVDAVALGALIQAKQVLHHAGKALHLTGARAKVAELLHLTGMIDELGVEPNGPPTTHD